MTKLFVATPAMDGKVFVQYAFCLANTQLYLASKQIPMEMHLRVSGSLLVAERNRIVKAFMQSDCTHLLCIDADMGWPAEAVGQLLSYEEDFVAVCYPARGPEKTFLFRAQYNPDHSIATHPTKKLLKMQYIPAGFMLISRKVFETMEKKYPELYFEPKDEKLKNEAAFAFFNTEIHEGEFWGEDFVFCRRVREAGFDIWVDPLIPLDHAGSIASLSQALTDKRENSNAPDVLAAKNEQSN